jgi:hypothetical protein
MMSACPWMLLAYKTPGVIHCGAVKKYSAMR